MEFYLFFCVLSLTLVLFRTIICRMQELPDREFYIQAHACIIDNFNKTNALYSQWAKNHKISRNNLIFFLCMENKETCSPSQLSIEWMISKQTLTGILRDLQVQGYIEIYPNPEDRRGKLIRLTAVGKEYSRSIVKPLKELEINAFKKGGREHTASLLKSGLVHFEAFKEALKEENRHD